MSNTSGIAGEHTVVLFFLKHLGQVLVSFFQETFPEIVLYIH